METTSLDPGPSDRRQRAVAAQCCGKESGQPGTMAEWFGESGPCKRERRLALPAQSTPVPPARTVRTSPSWTQDCPAVRKRTCRAPGQTPAAVRAECGRGRRRTRRRNRPARAPRCRTCPPTRRPKAAADRSASPRSTSSRVDASLSRATGRISGTPPARATCTASEYAFELRIWNSRGFSSTSTISSPVARIATRGLRYTGTTACPTVASIAMLAKSKRRPRGTTTAPRRASDPCGLIASPAATVRSELTRSPVRVTCSTITTASAPRGIGAPVMISSASPAVQPHPHTIHPHGPHRSPADRATLSTDRTANPSRTDRATGG